MANPKSIPAAAPVLQSASAIHGFTLIELMFVLVIGAILAAIAVPTYHEAVRKVRRAEARAALLEVMQQEERYYSRAGTYILFDSLKAKPGASNFRRFSGQKAATSAYEITVAACGEGDLNERNCIKLKATPGTDQVDKTYRDPVCGILTLTSTGIRANEPVDGPPGEPATTPPADPPAEPTATPSACW